VRAIVERMRSAGLDARAFGRSRVAAVGPGTAEALASIGIVADLLPKSFTTKQIGTSFPRGSGRVLLARADVVEPGLDEALENKGWTIERVVAYRLLGQKAMPADVRDAVLAGDIDVLTFASGGTVRAFMKLLNGAPPASTAVVCIGPVTAKAARDAGLRVRAVADPHTIPALAAAVMEAVSKKSKSRRPRRAR
jgi:uroporphyrinogen III methyltransferase/synthase